jgi:hypothetical protein
MYFSIVQSHYSNIVSVFLVLCSLFETQIKVYI